MKTQRIARVKNLLKQQEALLVSSVANIIYLSGFDGFSQDEREGYLVITKKRNYILTDGRYREAVEKNLPAFKLLEIKGSKRVKENLKEIIKEEKLRTILIDDNNIKISEYKTIKTNIKLLPDKNLVENFRSIKDDLEISEIKNACKLADKTFLYIQKELKIGITEIEIAKKIIIFILSNNCDISFNPIVAFGENSTSPHHVPGNKKLTKNSIVLLDFGVKYNNYCSDMTRTIFFGKATKEQKEIYNTVLTSQKLAAEYIYNNKNPKTKTADKIARDYITSCGFQTIPHSLGHGIGLEVHEAPRLSPNSDEVLKKGMVFSIEPGIYIQNSIGIRIEDLYLYNGKNTQLISKANKGIIEL